MAAAVVVEEVVAVVVAAVVVAAVLPVQALVAQVVSDRANHPENLFMLLQLLSLSNDIIDI